MFSDYLFIIYEAEIANIADQAGDENVIYFI